MASHLQHHASATSPVCFQRMSHLVWCDFNTLVSTCSSGDAEATAQQIWDAYLGGSGGSRPFGSAVLDGVDLDIENNHGSQYYADFVDKLQSLWSGASKRYYLTAVPQCKERSTDMIVDLGMHLL